MHHVSNARLARFTKITLPSKIGEQQVTEDRYFYINENDPAIKNGIGSFKFNKFVGNTTYTDPRAVRLEVCSFTNDGLNNIESFFILFTMPAAIVESVKDYTEYEKSLEIPNPWEWEESNDIYD